MNRSTGIALGLRDTEASTRVGVEHELRLWLGDDLVDFRSAIQQVAGQIRTLDPGDPRSRRLPSGLALTADGWEAELVSPPVDVGPEMPARLDRMLAADRSALLAAAIERGVADRITGFSTHLNISVADDLVVERAREFVRRCAVPLMLLTESPESPGLLVRPRRGRLEVGTEYVEGADLTAALTFFVSCAVALERDPAGAAVAVSLRVEASREKFGAYVDRCATGSDLGRLGRATPLSTSEGPTTAQQHLSGTWAWARPRALALGLDPTQVDDLVGGRRALPMERADRTSWCSTCATADAAEPGDTGPRWLTSHIEAETAWLTWSRVAWQMTDVRTGRSVSAVLEARQEEEFLARLDSGDLTPLVVRELGRRGPRRQLLANAQLRDAALWHDIRAGALVPAERTPAGLVPRITPRAVRRARRRSRPRAPEGAVR